MSPKSWTKSEINSIIKIKILITLKMTVVVKNVKIEKREGGEGYVSISSREGCRVRGLALKVNDALALEEQGNGKPVNTRKSRGVCINLSPETAEQGEPVVVE